MGHDTTLSLTTHIVRQNVCFILRMGFNRGLVSGLPVAKGPLKRVSGRRSGVSAPSQLCRLRLLQFCECSFRVLDNGRDRHVPLMSTLDLLDVLATVHYNA